MKKTKLTIDGDPAPGQEDPTPPPAPQSAPEPGKIASTSPLTVEQRITNVIKTVHDPEIPVNIYELGLIYDIAFDAQSGKAEIKMTLTSPACPVAQELPLEVQTKVQTIAEVTLAIVDVVWDPPWTPDMMSEDARLLMNM